MIGRLSICSVLLKGCGAVIITGGVIASALVPASVGFTVVPVLALWALDGYFLAKERHFRQLYDHVRLRQGTNGGYDLSLGQVRTDTTPARRWVQAVTSVTLWGFWLAMLTVAVGAAVRYLT